MVGKLLGRGVISWHAAKSFAKSLSRTPKDRLGGATVIEVERKVELDQIGG